jgi:hypothetical protein
MDRDKDLIEYCSDEDNDGKSKILLKITKYGTHYNLENMFGT